VASNVTLDASESLDLKVRNLSEFWIDADTGGEGIAWAVEQEKSNS
jgi:hypothetical protein